MTKIWYRIPLCLLLCASFLTACVSTQQSLRAKPDELQRRVATWLGMPRDFLEKYWGVSKQTEDMGMGLRYITYKPRGKKAKNCAVIFTVDITNTVKGGEWRGDRKACLQFVRAVPSLSPGQQLVDAF